MASFLASLSSLRVSTGFLFITLPGAASQELAGWYFS
jgi:hypothetical protein